MLGSCYAYGMSIIFLALSRHLSNRISMLSDIFETIVNSNVLNFVIIRKCNIYIKINDELLCILATLHNFKQYFLDTLKEIHQQIQSKSN